MPESCQHAQIKGMLHTCCTYEHAKLHMRIAMLHIGIRHDAHMDAACTYGWVTHIWMRHAHIDASRTYGWVTHIWMSHANMDESWVTFKTCHLIAIRKVTVVKIGAEGYACRYFWCQLYVLRVAVCCSL